MAKKIYVVSKFNSNDEIESSFVNIDGAGTEVDLYKKNTGLTISQVEARIKKLRGIFQRSSDTIICNDFKKHIKSLGLALDRTDYNVYQINIDKSASLQEAAQDLANVKILPYQKVIANSQVVYQALEESGLYINYELVHPIYSTDTFSGRSKAKFFNIQGYTADDHIRTPYVNEDELLILFDWISADIRVASIFSGDHNLEKSFEHSDPYTYMVDLLNGGSKDKITRDECKTYLLKSINSMDWTSSVLYDIYPRLADWIKECDLKLNDPESYLTTLLSKRIYMRDAKNKLAVLNGSMQGSVAHAMQATLNRLYSQIPHRIVCDIHDSLVINAPSDKKEINKLIKIVTDIMKRPFDGLLDGDYVFPIKVSIGNKWKKWKYLSTVR